MAGSLLATGNTLSGQPAGVYHLLAADSAGCTVDTLVILSDQGGLVAGIDPAFTEPATCYGTATGRASVTAAGGTGAYAYLWSRDGLPVDSNVISYHLPAGIIVVSVTDQVNCKTFAWTTIGQPDSISLAVTTTDVRCFGANDGSLSALATGGNGNFSYWLTGPGARTGNILTDLEPGVWTLTVTDPQGCLATAVRIITESPLLSATHTPAINNTNDQAPYTGKVTVAGKGGVPPYTYQWYNCRGNECLSPTGGPLGPILSGVAADSFAVKITDSNGCTFFKRFSIKGKCADIADSASYCFYGPFCGMMCHVGWWWTGADAPVIAALNLYPNPARSEIHLAAELTVRDQVTISITALDGKEVFRRTFPPVLAVSEVIPVENFARGTYLVRVTTSQGEASQKLMLE